jgi:hypothetical protein
MNKMSKRSFVLLSILLGLLASAMIFLPSLVLKGSDTSFTGLQVAFGVEFASLGSLASGEISFNILVLLAYALPLVGVILMAMSNRTSMLTNLVFAAAAILIFLIPNFTQVTVTLLGNPTVVEVEWTYGIGLILAASSSILAAVIGLLGSSESR